jgi:F420-dependent oxidoreductase-like protein
MELCIFTEPQQGFDYEELLASAQLTERLGFDGWFRSDHYLKMGDFFDGLPGSTDAWTTLAGLARETSRIRLGTLVSSATYRHPGILAIQVAQVDRMSGGRAELGLGTGWYAAEHRAYAIPFPEKRFGILEEQLEIVNGLWSTPIGESYDFAGEHYTLEDSPALPKPLQDRLPVIVGGAGAKRTPMAAARFATEYNIGFVDDSGVAAAFARVREAVDNVGREPQSLKYSVAQPTVVGETEDDFQRRAAAIGADPAELRAKNLGGTRSEVEDRLGRLRDLGAERIYLQVIDLADTDHMKLIAEIARPLA